MTKPANLWGGRFIGTQDETFSNFNNSLRFDRRLLEPDIRASIAHASGLVNAGVLTSEEGAAVTAGLTDFLERCKADPAMLDRSDAEDVHSFIETSLVELVGDTGKKLHTGRSRNDQVATAFRIWMRDEISMIDQVLRRFQEALVDNAEQNFTCVLPGYTHLQRAQPVLWAHWCLAYFEMIARDRQRFSEAAKRVNTMPLGSAALAGTAFDIDRDAVAKELGFVAITLNSLDAVSDRDFAVEFTGVCALALVHLSRFAEDLIIYSTTEFGFVEMGDAVATGSSLMPQKKNPDALELIRGKAGRVIGHNTALLAMLKGLPLAYNKDMQEDKEAVFDCADTVDVCFRVGEIVLRNIRLNEAAMRSAATSGYLNATELADYLVKKGSPFRDAHEAAGRAVLVAIESGVELSDLALSHLRGISDLIGDDVYEALTLERTIASKNARGGTSTEQVRAALKDARRRLSA